MSLFISYLYDGEKDHLAKSLELSSKIADDIYVFCQKYVEESLSDLKDKYCLNIFTVKWEHDFSKIRNYAIKKISEKGNIYDWIFMLDSDESLDPNECWKINSMLDMCSQDDNVCGFRVNIINNNEYWTSPFLGENKRNLKDKDVRIFRCYENYSFKGRINEKLDLNPSLVKDSDIHIYHHAYRYTEEEERFLKYRMETLNIWNRIEDDEKNSFIKDESVFKENKNSKIKTVKEKRERKKIGFFCLHYEPPIGGAERSMHNYFKKLYIDYDIDVFCFMNDDGKPFRDNCFKIEDGININMSNRRIDFEVNDYIRSQKPDLIVTQLLGSDTVVDVAYNNDIPCVYFAHSFFEDICTHYLLRSCPENNLATCSFGGHCPNGQAHRRHLEKYTKCATIICNSQYTKDMFNRFFPSITNKIKIACPNFNYDLFFKTKEEMKNKVLAVNSSPMKGRNIVINLAAANPDIHFVYLDAKRNDFINIPVPKNLELKEKVSREEMAAQYNEVDAVIYPTLMDETFGGVVVESILSGTPVVCPNKGNLSNLIKDGVNGKILYNDYSTESWTSALRKAMEIEIPEEEIRQLRNKVDEDKNTSIIKKEIDRITKNKEREEYFIMETSNKKDEPNIDGKKNGKKIVFFAKYFYPPLGGGETFLLKVLKFLKEEHGYDCSSVCYFDGRNDLPFIEEKQCEWEGIPVKQIVMRGFSDIKRVMEEENPDLVITQSFDALYIIKAAKAVGAKTILGTHFWRNICEVKEVFHKMLSRPLSTVKLLNQFHPAFHLADECYVNSEFMRLGVKKYVGKDIERIICPPINLEKIAIRERKAKYITMVNPDFYKGGDFFVKLAQAMPTNNFLCVGKAPGEDRFPANRKINEQLNSLHNVLVLDKTDNIYDIYEKTKIMLVPSIVDETFSMVALESMWNEIPTIVAPNGNLPYLVESGGFVLDLDVEIWKETISQLLNDKEYYNIMAEAAKTRSRDFSPDKELDKFLKMVKKCIG